MSGDINFSVALYSPGGNSLAVRAGLGLGKAQGVCLASGFGLADYYVLLFFGTVCQNVINLEKAAGQRQSRPAVLVNSDIHQDIGHEIQIISAVLFRQSQHVIAGLAVVIASLLGVLLSMVAFLEVLGVVTALHEFVDAFKKQLLFFGHRKLVHMPLLSCGISF